MVKIDYFLTTLVHNLLYGKCLISLKQGSVLAEGSYHALTESGLDFMNILGTGEVEEKSHDPLIEECGDPTLKPLHTRQVSVQVCGEI